MADWLQSTLISLVDTPALQAAFAGFCTFILEDPTTVTCGILVAEGRMAFMTALVGLTVGIALGDLGLYAIGRAVGPNTVAWGWVTQDRLDRVRHWFDRNVILAVFLSRFIPGTRLPTYVGAGIFQASVWRFLGAAVTASLLWTFLLLTAVVKLGEAVLPQLGRFKWPVAIALIVAIILMQRRTSKRLLADNAPSEAVEPVASLFEFWPPFVFYIPVGFYYAWLALRYRSFTLPTAVNPSIYSGGLIGESKSQILSLVPKEQRKWVATHTPFMRPSADTPLETVLQQAERAMEEAGIAFPVVAKPDTGQRGAGVQRIPNAEELRRYLREFPANTPMVLQALVDLPHEAGVLYYRNPRESRGHIMSVTLKEFPFVIGDGVHTLQELILADPRAVLIKDVYLRRHTAQLDRVLAEGERFRLVFAGNHAQGAVFRDGRDCITPELEARIHEIASSIPEFYFGRFDIRFESLDAFVRGEGLNIVEINGAGAEATHIWDARATLSNAYKTLFRQFRILFEIGAENRRRGHRALGPVRLLRDCYRYRQASRAYPLTH
ncbi:MAG: VTT domain-containing protein [Candidatus Hydrogenedentes bacterium]|nr:VTT domain-containing protein [Candidatus Hydrogenedentota bacterium]